MLNMEKLEKLVVDLKDKAANNTYILITPNLDVYKGSAMEISRLVLKDAVKEIKQNENYQ
jgi:hypothetical protein